MHHGIVVHHCNKASITFPQRHSILYSWLYSYQIRTVRPILPWYGLYLPYGPGTCSSWLIKLCFMTLHQKSPPISMEPWMQRFTLRRTWLSIQQRIVRYSVRSNSALNIELGKLLAKISLNAIICNLNLFNPTPEKKDVLYYWWLFHCCVPGLLFLDLSLDNWIWFARYWTHPHHARQLQT